MAVNLYIAEADLFIDYDGPENDPFTTFWDGPFDPIALRYAARTGVSYIDEYGNTDITMVSSSESKFSYPMHSRQQRHASYSRIIVSGLAVSKSYPCYT